MLLSFSSLLLLVSVLVAYAVAWLFGVDPLRRSKRVARVPNVPVLEEPMERMRREAGVPRPFQPTQVWTPNPARVQLRAASNPPGRDANEYDVVICGAGVAGLFQALYLQRKTVDLGYEALRIAIVDPLPAQRDGKRDLKIGESTVFKSAAFIAKDLGLGDYLIENHCAYRSHAAQRCRRATIEGLRSTTLLLMSGWFGRVNLTCACARALR